LPRPTPFPYTTLFRSWPEEHVAESPPAHHHASQVFLGTESAHDLVFEPPGFLRQVPTRARRRNIGEERLHGAAWIVVHGNADYQDRKSTRLNSSHLVI